MKYLIKNYTHRKCALSGAKGDTVIVAPNATQIEELREMTPDQLNNLLSKGLEVTPATSEDEDALKKAAEPKTPVKKTPAAKKAAVSAPDNKVSEPVPAPPAPPAEPQPPAGNSDVVGAAPWQKGLGA